MKTWRNIFILGILVSLAACTKMENVYVPETISYSVGTYANATKVSPLNDVASDNITSFRSKSWLHAGNDPTVPQLFFDETITYDGTSVWAPANVYYWPKHPQSYLNFVSWYDALGNPTTVTENTVSWENRTIQAGDNILLAQKAWKQKANSQTYYTSGVPTLFRHLLAQVEFKARATAVTKTTGSVTTTWSVEISNFRVNGVHNVGSITLTNDTEPAVQSGPVISEWTTTGWTVSSATAALNGTDLALTTSPETVVPCQGVLPQAVAGVSLSFDYAITTTTTKSGASHTFTETVHVQDLALSDFEGYSGNWEMNKRIIYKIAINPETSVIVIVPTVVEWTTASSGIVIE